MNTDQIKYTPNKFEFYTSTRSFSLGTTGVSIPEGVEVQFDGTTLIFNEERMAMPTLRGAIRQKWLVPTGTYRAGQPQAAPISANIGLRPAVTNEQSLTTPPVRTAAVTVQSDERVVLTRAGRVENANQQRIAAARSQGYEIEEQDARPVARAFQTSAKTSTDMSRAGEAISRAEKVAIKPGEGLSEGEYLARLSPEEAANYLAEKERLKAAKGVTSPATPTVVRKVAASTPTSSEGISATVMTGGGVETFMPSGGDVKPILSSSTAEGISFSNTNGPGTVRAAQPASAVPTGKDLTEDARRLVAKAMCVDFPDNYSFDDHWKRRIARIQLDYVDRPDVIRAIFAAETDDFKRMLLAEFPEAFQG